MAYLQIKLSKNLILSLFKPFYIYPSFATTLYVPVSVLFLTHEQNVFEYCCSIQLQVQFKVRIVAWESGNEWGKY